MSALAPRQRHILVVETDPDIRDILAIFLTEEGFTVHFAASLQETLALIDKKVFQLVLADPFMGKPPGISEEAQFLHRRAWPTPLGLMTTQNISAKQAKQQGFAFLLKKPFDLEQLLLSITAVLPQPLSPEQLSQVQVVERFFSAITARDFNTLLALCADEVICYPPANSPIAPARKMVGKAALRTHMERIHRYIKQMQFDEALAYGQPKGLAVRYGGRWLLYDETERPVSGVLHARFEGERIRRIGLRISPEHLRALPGG